MEGYKSVPAYLAVPVQIFLAGGVVLNVAHSHCFMSFVVFPCYIFSGEIIGAVVVGFWPHFHSHQGPGLELT